MAKIADTSLKKFRLEIFRKNIDQIDSQLLALLTKRARVVEKVGIWKRENDVSVYDARRENKILKRVADLNTGPLSNAAVKRIFQAIIQECRLFQKNGAK